MNPSALFDYPTHIKDAAAEHFLQLLQLLPFYFFLKYKTNSSHFSLLIYIYHTMHSTSFVVVAFVLFLLPCLHETRLREVNVISQ